MIFKTLLHLLMLPGDTPWLPSRGEFPHAIAVKYEGLRAQFIIV